jgi:hypothetical protein
MTRTIDQMIASEVLCCMSSLVSTLALASTVTTVARHSPSAEVDLYNLCEQALGLVSSVDDWEEAAIENGWIKDGAWHGYDHDKYPNWLAAEANGECSTYDTAQEACEANDIEPVQAEVFEHWAVTDWFADKLEAAGEKVDRDFAGLNVWGRTTTGQSIAMDGVIARIYAQTHQPEPTPWLSGATLDKATNPNLEG